MIYTVTFNPALDYSLFMDQFALGATNRASHERLTCGGKGINVSVVLHRLGMETVALGFLAGYTGRILEALVQGLGVSTDFIHLADGMSRINVKLKYQGETELNGRGPDITQAALGRLYAKLDRMGTGDTLVLAGSIPASLPPHIYEQILHRIEGRGIRTVVDATGPLLDNVLPYHPFLIKPNHEELGALCGEALSPDDVARVVHCAGLLQARGARNVLVSMAGAGALLCTEDGRCFQQSAAQGTVVNSVGAGDSMVAGFLAGYCREDWAQALLLGTAAGGATAFSEDLASRSQIDALLKTLSKCREI